MLASTKGTRGTPGWSMHDISCETSQTSRFSVLRPSLSTGKRNERTGGVKREGRQGGSLKETKIVNRVVVT